MTKRNTDLNFASATNTYVTVAALIASAALVGVIAVEMIARAKQTPDQTFYALACMTFVLIWMVSERLLKRTVYGVTLTTRWQDRLTFAIPTGFFFSAHMLHGTTGLWAVGQPTDWRFG